MDRTQVADRLAREGTPDALYEIPGVHPVPFPLDAYYVLRGDGDHWLVLLRQRGQEEALGRFATEAEACDCLYDMIIQAPAPVPGAARRVARLLSRSDEIQRQAWRDFERAPRPGEDGEPGDAETSGS